MPPSVRIRVVRNDMSKIADELHDDAARIVAKTAFDIEALTKQNIAAHGLIDTSTLINSVRATMETPLRWRVNVGAFYGIFHEFGTRFLPARPFLFPAANSRRQPFVDAMQGLLRRSA